MTTFTGTSGSDDIVGHYGDIINAGGGDDQLFNASFMNGEAGNDVLNAPIASTDFIFMSGGLGDDVLNGDGNSLAVALYYNAATAVHVDLSFQGVPQNTGEGNDTLNGVHNVVGSIFNDVLLGGAANEGFSGGPGNDTINGGGGFDLVDYTADFVGSVVVDLAIATAQNTGTWGSDTITNVESISGTVFNDILSGDASGNLLLGQDGDDILNGRGGNDTLDGGAGSDTITYVDASGAVTIDLSVQGNQNTGGSGIDALFGIENVTGSAFADQLAGSSADNALSGLGGNDTLEGSSLGNDTLDGGLGSDTASFAAAPSGITISLALQGVGQFNSGAGTDTLVSIENLVGSSYADILTGDSGANVISGGGGNDIIDGGDGNDTLDGGSGANTASYASAASAVAVSLGLQGAAQDSQGAGIDTLANIQNLTGSGFNDDLTGDANANVLHGGNGSDTLRGQTGDDAIYGEGGNDYIEGGDGNDTIDGGAGFNIAAYASASAGVVVNLGLQGAFQDTQGAGNDLISNVENLVGSGFNDDLSGDGQTNALYGGNGNDTLHGQAGDDNLFGQAGSDYLDGGTGNDVIDGGAGFNVVAYTSATHFVVVDLNLQGVWQDTQGAGNDLITNVENLTGSDLNDTLSGDGQTNVINGGLGDDTLYGRAGDDNLLGQAGNDYIEGGDGNDVIDGGAGFNLAAYGTASHFVVLDLGMQGVWQDTQGAGNDFITNVENLIGSAFNDNLTGDGQANVIYGGNGDDTLYGKGGNDTLFGQAGNDYIDGGQGNDSLTGNTGADAFVFGASFGHDTVTDFAPAGAGHDVIILLASMFANFAAVQSHMTQSGSDVVISDGLGDAITLSNVLTTNLSAGDFTFV